MLKILKVYLEIIAAGSERLWSLTSELSAAKQTETESDEYSDDFDHSGTSFLQSSEEEHYGRLICRIFLKDCSVELLIMHLTSCCRTAHVRDSEPTKTLWKLANLVAQMLAKFAENIVNRLPADSKHRVEISEHWSERLMTLLADEQLDDFVCLADFVDIMNSFVPITSLSMLERLMVLLLQSPEKCVSEQLEEGSRTLSHRGRLLVHVLQHILNRLVFIQPQVLIGMSMGLCKILKLVPFDSTICSSLTVLAKQMPLFASNIKPAVVSSLLKSGMQPSLNLMMSLAVDNEHCKQLMFDWFATHKIWKREERLDLYVDAVSFILKACQKG